MFSYSGTITITYVVMYTYTYKNIMCSIFYVMYWLWYYVMYWHEVIPVISIPSFSDSLQNFNMGPHLLLIHLTIMIIPISLHTY